VRRVSEDESFFPVFGAVAEAHVARELHLVVGAERELHTPVCDKHAEQESSETEKNVLLFQLGSQKEFLPKAA
jgi:hypothetical protein